MPTPAKLITATLINRLQLNADTYQLTLQLPEAIGYEAGQYINLRFETKFRPYSIASLPNETNTIDLCIDVKPGGPGSQFAASAPVGTSIQGLIPLGKFVVTTVEQPFYFIATSSGIGPFRAMIGDLVLNRKITEPITLLWGLRTEGDIYWEDEWRTLARTDSAFNWVYCLSRETNKQTDNPHRFYGYVGDWLQSQMIPAKAVAYLCGNDRMVTEVSDLLKTLGMVESDIRFEKFN